MKGEFLITSNYDMDNNRVYTSADEYRFTKLWQDQLVYRLTPFSGEFPHLLNFHADQSTGAATDAFQLHRLFDYVEVPSRFTGTETYVNPDQFVSGATNFNSFQSAITMSFAAPFDFVSNYRVPGKININTLQDQDSWNALMWQGADFQVPNTMQFANWQTNRGGDDFENPYRYAHTRNYVANNSNGLMVESDRADVGLFRRQDTGNAPLFDFDPSTADQYRSADRSAYFRNQVRQRLGNLVTMRSSVFAIWITVGYFEVRSFDADTNSVRLNFIANEVTDVSGAPIRNRGFFIFDRSIPVAFEPGRNHNIDKAIRISSYIE